MTRINLVDPRVLCDKHLLAEHRELVRIPNCIKSGRLSLVNQPKAYTVRTEDNPAGGVGHVKFFGDKLEFLRNRYNKLHRECIKRGFNVSYYWDIMDTEFPNNFNDYIPTVSAITLNMTRIIERIPIKPRLNGVLQDREEFKNWFALNASEF